MKRKQLMIFALMFALVGGVIQTASAQQHRATQLGSPSTRFAPPLSTPDDLRALFQNERLQADIGAILQQSGWQGNQADLRHAAATAEIRELSIPPGTRLPAMSTRKKGRPVLLQDVLWAGKKPIDAYEFTLTSNDRRYRVITPKACSNFWVESVEPEFRPGLEAIKTAPADASLCEPFEMRVAVRNAGKRIINQVQVTDSLPAGLKTLDDRTSLSWDVGTLDPAEGREFRFQVVAATTGAYTNTARVTSADGGNLEASAITMVRTPVLHLACAAPPEVYAGRPAEVCVTVTNSGDVLDPKATIELPIPEGAKLGTTTEAGVDTGGRVVWEIQNLAPQASRKVCASFTLAQPGSLSFEVGARGACAPPAQTQCATRVVGIPAILVEVIDLEDPIEVGQQTTYEVRVTNQGSAVGTNLKVVCTLAEGQEYVAGSGSTPVHAQGRIVTLEPLAALEPKGVASWRVVIKATEARDARFKAEVTSDQFHRPIQEFEATEQY